MENDVKHKAKTKECFIANMKKNHQIKRRTKNTLKST